MNQQAFFQLLRIALGTQKSLSQPLTDEEWHAAFAVARKQSMLGMCCVAVQALDSDVCPSKQICRELLSNAEPIRKSNQILGMRCAELDRKLEMEGFRACILKGQSLSRYYGDAACYRSTGDIDVWVDAPVSRIVQFLTSSGADWRATYVHVETDLFEDVRVEIHPQPAILSCPWLNARLQRWTRSFDMSGFDRTRGFAVVPVEFDAVYLLVHMLHHLLFEGIGLRQFMDYAFLLRNSDMQSIAGPVKQTISSLRMTRFSKGVMWIMQEVFGLSEDCLLFEPDPIAGKVLLAEIMAGGDFGKYDERYSMARSSNKLSRMWGGIVRNISFVAVAPSEVICDPFWRTWHFVWRKRRRYM